MGILDPKTQQMDPAVSNEAAAPPVEKDTPVTGDAGSGENSAQDMFDMFVINAIKILHSPKVTKGIINRVVNAPDKVDAIGETALDIVHRLEQSAGKNKFPVTANTVMNGANAIISEIITMAEAAGMPPVDKEQAYQAYTWAISNYIDQAVKTGRISKEELIQLGQQMGQTPEGKQIAEKAVTDEQSLSQGQGGM